MKPQPRCWLVAVTGPVDVEQEAGMAVLIPFP